MEDKEVRASELRRGSGGRSGCRGAVGVRGGCGGRRAHVDSREERRDRFCDFALNCKTCRGGTKAFIGGIAIYVHARNPDTAEELIHRNDKRT